MMNNSPFVPASYPQCIRAAFISACMLIGTGCNLSDPGLSSYVPPDQYFAAFALEQRAINLSTTAPYDTITLKTIRAMGDGSAVPGTVTYSVSNSAISVTDEGVLKAEKSITRAIVEVKLTYGKVTRIDTAVVSVTGTAPNALSEFGFDLLAGDSAKRSARSGGKTIHLKRNSGSGTTLSAIHVSVWSTDSTIASIKQSGDNLLVTPKRPGRVVLYATTYAYGTEFQDSLVFTVGWPIDVVIPVYEKFLTGTTTKILEFGFKNFTLGVGSCVKWLTQSKELDIDVVFDDPSHVVAPVGKPCGGTVYDPSIGGNIEPYRQILWDNREPLGEDATEEEFEAYIDALIKVQLSVRRARVFSAGGVYPFRSTIHGTSGTIRVCDEFNDTTCAPSGIGPWF